MSGLLGGLLLKRDRTDEIQRLHACINGRVQGVGFRWYVIQTVRTRTSDVQGWVKNLHDGRVEVLAEGPTRQLEVLLGALHKGPSGSIVDEVDEEWSAPRGGLLGFDVTF